MASVRFNDVTKNFGNFVAVANLNLEVVDKEFLVLLGPSGCGKTTTMRMVAGLEEVSSGDLYFGNERMNDVLPKYRDVAMVFQSYALYPHLTVADNIGYPLMIRKVPAAELKRRVEEVARRVELQALLDAAAARAVGRPAPASGAGAGDHQDAQGVPARRAAVQSRCQAPGPDAGRAQAAAA